MQGATRILDSPTPVSWTTLESTRLAYERTLMAWVRTTMAVITFGFSIYKFFQYLEETQGQQLDRLVTPRGFGLGLIIAGLSALLLATLQHVRGMAQLRAQLPAMPRSIALLLAALISALGILALFAAIFRQ
jgi:putative membrane protein